MQCLSWDLKCQAILTRVLAASTLTKHKTGLSTRQVTVVNTISNQSSEMLRPELSAINIFTRLHTKLLKLEMLSGRE
ncbi:hypothetical protein M8J76_007264 [Diaphorina citri]|nr:hypothetical protein M8J76_007264 [Diaphorina citri]